MQKPPPRNLSARHLFDGLRWLNDVTLAIGADGNIEQVLEGTDPTGERIDGVVLPGLVNLHSHAFQRVMAGLAERRDHPEDSFWSWRELMYRIANRIGPDQVQAIATWLYIEMLKAGYTGVCEFHYLHHAPGGERYTDPAELSRRHLAAAEVSGIGMTLTPVLYQRGGFDGRPLEPHQQRFGHQTDEFLVLLAHLDASAGPQVAIGAAFHSLRAVGQEAMSAILAERPEGPIHVHVAEQLREVEECLAVHDRRPVQWLCDEMPLDERWCLVHATHLDDREVRTAAATGAVAGLCPTTEGNLGDGLFPMPEWLAAGGAWGIGSDSHVSVNPVEELRWLEYGQRLIRHRRNVMATEEQPHVGAALWSGGLAGGAQASGRPVGRLAPGHRADLLVIRPSGLDTAGDRLLDRLVFADGAAQVKDVMVGGRWCVRDGRHPQEASSRAAFLRVMREVVAD